MKNIRNPKNGLTLIECLISFALAAIALTASAAVIVNSQILSSIARHKTQAAYAAQQILEQERRLPFPNLVSLASAAVTLDTNGTYADLSDDFMGNRVVTVTVIDAYRKKVQVEINWQEHVITGKLITMREFYATTFVNEPDLN